jgi:hypothetical protein
MLQDQTDCRLYVAVEVTGGKVEDAKAPARQPGIAPGVAAWVRSHVVDFAVDFDAELGCGAAEVEAVGSDRVLAAEPEAIRAGPQYLPQSGFGSGHPAA